jgi:hypothetical protein
LVGADERDFFAAVATRAHDDWRARHCEMKQWYEAPAATPDELAAALDAEYRGRVLDVGGDAGLAAMVLPREVD